MNSKNIPYLGCELEFEKEIYVVVEDKTDHTPPKLWCETKEGKHKDLWNAFKDKKATVTKWAKLEVATPKDLEKPSINREKANRILQEAHNLNELAKNGMPELNWIVQDFLPESGLLIIGAEPKTYKSYIAQLISLNVALGTKLFGHIPTYTGKVLYIDHENNPRVLLRRFLQLQNGHRIEKLPDNLIICCDTGIRLDTDEGRNILNYVLQEVKPQLVVIDSIVRFMEGDEDTAKDVRKIFENLKPLMELHKTSFLALHHTRKDARGGSYNGLRGSGDFTASADCVLMLEKEKSGPVAYMSANRHIDSSEYSKFQIVVSNPSEDKDESIHFGYSGNPPERLSAPERARKHIIEWIVKDNVEEFQRKDAVNKVKRKGIGERSIDDGLKLMHQNKELCRENNKYLAKRSDFIDDINLAKPVLQSSANKSEGKVIEESSKGGDLSPLTTSNDTLQNSLQNPTIYAKLQSCKVNKTMVLDWVRNNPEKSVDKIAEGLETSPAVVEQILTHLETKGDVFQSKHDRWRVLE